MLKINESQSTFIDLLRGCSAQIVLLGHLISFYFIEQQIIIQNLGVLIFFILSGHLISISALKPTGNKFPFRQFMTDRFVRIYVALIPAVLICYLLDHLSLQIGSVDKSLFEIDNLTTKNLIASLLNLGGLPSHLLSFISNGYIKFEPVGSMRPLWTVAIEWWLYVVIALGFMLFNKKVTAFLFTVMALFILLIQFYFDITSGYFVLSLWLLSSAYTIYNIKLSTRLALFLSVPSLFFLFYRLFTSQNTYFYEPLNMLLIFIIYFSFIQLLKEVKFSMGFKKVSSFLSSYSYSLYLVHYTLIVFLKPILDLDAESSLFVLFVLSNVFAYLFYYVFERNHRKVRKLFNNFRVVNNKVNN